MLTPDAAQPEVVGSEEVEVLALFPIGDVGQVAVELGSLQPEVPVDDDVAELSRPANHGPATSRVSTHHLAT